MFYSIYQVLYNDYINIINAEQLCVTFLRLQSWQRDKAKKEAREARRREREEEEQDPISQLIKEAIAFQKNFKDSVESKKKLWKNIKEK